MWLHLHRPLCVRRRTGLQEHLHRRNLRELLAKPGTSRASVGRLDRAETADLESAISPGPPPAMGGPAVSVGNPDAPPAHGITSNPSRIRPSMETWRHRVPQCSERVPSLDVHTPPSAIGWALGRGGPERCNHIWVNPGSRISQHQSLRRRGDDRLAPGKGLFMSLVRPLDVPAPLLDQAHQFPSGDFPLFRHSDRESAAPSLERRESRHR